MSSNVRIIPRLDIKGPNLIKGIHLEGLRKIGDPNEFAKKYYLDGADEIIYMDVVASLYGRNNLEDIVKSTVKNVYVPITVGGGIASCDDVKRMLRSGAEKISINTAAVKNPELISEISKKFGSQCVVISIEAKRVGPSKWEVLIENGREKTGIDVLEWAKKMESLSAGEILLTSIDQEGTGNGFDYELIKQISSNVSIPVIACGGMNSSSDAIKVIDDSCADAIALSRVLHYGIYTIQDIRNDLKSSHINVRDFNEED
tara:strand:- start:1226 stop:2002 length:777 start_codon:yes stop_codon:yes gene_type:complete